MLRFYSALVVSVFLGKERFRVSSCLHNLIDVFPHTCSLSVYLFIFILKKEAKNIISDRCRLEDISVVVQSKYK